MSTYEGLFIFAKYTRTLRCIYMGTSSSWAVVRAQRVKTGEKWLFQKHQTELCQHKKHILRCVVLGQGYFSPARQPLFLLPSSFFELQLSLVIYCCAQFSCHKNETKCIESNADLQKVCSRRSQTATAVNISAQASSQQLFGATKQFVTEKSSSSSRSSPVSLFEWVMNDFTRLALHYLRVRAPSFFFGDCREIERLLRLWNRHQQKSTRQGIV